MKLRNLNTQSAPINTQPMLNEVSGMSRFRGSYSLCGFITSIDKNGQPYRKVGICDFNHHLFIQCAVVAHHWTPWWMGNQFGLKRN